MRKGMSGPHLHGLAGGRSAETKVRARRWLFGNVRVREQASGMRGDEEIRGFAVERAAARTCVAKKRIAPTPD